VIGQYGGGGAFPLQDLKSSTMEDVPAGISSFGIYYFAKLVVGKHVRNSLHLSTPTGSFLEEQTLDSFIQGEESILLGEMGNLAEGLVCTYKERPA
jgi:hypothetical protein